MSGDVLCDKNQGIGRIHIIPDDSIQGGLGLPVQMQLFNNILGFYRFRLLEDFANIRSRGRFFHNFYGLAQNRLDQQEFISIFERDIMGPVGIQKIIRSDAGRPHVIADNALADQGTHHRLAVMGNGA